VTIRISSLTKEYVRIPVAAREAGAVVNPTGLPVQLAFVGPNTEPVEGDWKTGTWETDGPNYFARVVVGPGTTLILADGVYAAWIRIGNAGDTERPVKLAGKVIVE
jgi:hypothetical protein